MKAIEVSIRRIGNSHGLVIPKPVLAQLGLDGESTAEMTVEGNSLIVRKSSPKRRQGWAEASKKIAEAGDDKLVMGEFANLGDEDLVW